jgi:hypothetical protein
VQSILQSAFDAATSHSHSTDKRRHADTATDSAAAHNAFATSFLAAAYSSAAAVIECVPFATRKLAVCVCPRIKIKIDFALLS